MLKQAIRMKILESDLTKIVKMQNLYTILSQSAPLLKNQHIDLRKIYKLLTKDFTWKERLIMRLHRFFDKKTTKLFDIKKG